MSYICTWTVSGMTCKSCEKNIVETLKQNPIISHAEASVRLSRVTATLLQKPSAQLLQELNTSLQKFGYVLSEQGCVIPNKTKKPFNTRLWRAVFAIGIAVWLGSILLPLIQGIAPKATATAAIGAMFVLGLIASVSTCLMSTGGFLLAYTAEAATKKRTILVHVGRLFAFCIGGAVLGALGGALPSVSTWWYGVVALLLGFGFIGVALHLLDLSPSLATFGISLPDSFSKFGNRVRESKNPAAPLAVGAVTFILPCGFTQTAQALALASSSFMQGALIMTAFALGTLPVLAGLTLFATKARFSHPAVRLIAGAVIFVFALGQLQAGAAVFGFSLPTNLDSAGSVAIVNAQEQIASMEINSYGYSPSQIIIKKDIPVKWQVYLQDASGCTSSLLSRELHISSQLKKGMNEFTFTPTHTGKIAFSCGMGMVRGSFNVIQ